MLYLPRRRFRTAGSHRGSDDDDSWSDRGDFQARKHQARTDRGAGTIVDIETTRRCLDAGAKFLTSPGLDIKVVEFACRNDVVVFPGALTPSEIMAAWNAGADFVKVFPCSLLGGASYIKALKSPFPKVPLIASGGVTQGTSPTTSWRELRL